ncbi:MAG: hypothetical protein ABJG80_21265 [Paracoccaceae bacterium]
MTVSSQKQGTFELKRMIDRCALILGFFLLAVPSWACSFGGNGRYEPSVSVNAQENQEIPSPILKETDLQRGTVAAGFSCDDAGVFRMEISLPEGDKRNIKEFGLQFEVVEGTDLNEIFPDVPVALSDDMSTISSSVLFAWLDGSPKEHLPLEMTIEVRFVYGTQKGPPLRFRMK